eukprot:TRINITY_DN2547_c1_g2_i2.p1 TRINITY_DN2547_c1_g2~~TRINITY_DN2547_c1_g2_i2.p1  ORF type:complete len:161 (+),score=15.50 TRINITY_DN2547_c1_g2_i2:12-494(+)
MDKSQAVNFFVFVHGNHGHSQDWNKFETQLNATFHACGSILWILKSSHNQLDTSIGVMKGGQILAQEILTEFRNIRALYPSNLLNVTMCAHSLGGLFSRAALEHIFHSDNANLIKNIRWVGLTTISSPHIDLEFDRIIEFVLGILSLLRPLQVSETSEMK